MTRRLLILAAVIAAVALVTIGCSSDDGGGGDGGGNGSGGEGGGGAGGGGDGADSFDDQVPDCSGGETSANIDSDVPEWIQENFTCVRAYLDGGNIVIQTKNLPPYSSYYYAAGGDYSDQHDDTEPTEPNPNEISEQAVTMTVPSNPAMADSTSETDLGPVGIAVDGIVIYNNSANPPDVLADEVDTMDVNGAHPDQFGMYHYHFEPPQISDDDDALIGIAMDGFPIYGILDENGDIAFDAAGGEEYDGDNCRVGDDDIPRYHAVANTQQEDDDGDIIEIPYLIGTNFCGTPGTATW